MTRKGEYARQQSTNTDYMISFPATESPLTTLGRPMMAATLGLRAKCPSICCCKPTHRAKPPYDGCHLAAQLLHLLRLLPFRLLWEVFPMLRGALLTCKHARMHIPQACTADFKSIYLDDGLVWFHTSMLEMRYSDLFPQSDALPANFSTPKSLTCMCSPHQRLTSKEFGARTLHYFTHVPLTAPTAQPSPPQALSFAPMTNHVAAKSEAPILMHTYCTAPSPFCALLFAPMMRRT